jgi:hypothetical protein
MAPFRGGRDAGSATLALGATAHAPIAARWSTPPPSPTARAPTPQPLYHVSDRPQDVWNGAWATRVPRLFDGRHDDVAILKRLPRTLPRLFTPALRARLGAPRTRCTAPRSCARAGTRRG